MTTCVLAACLAGFFAGSDSVLAQVTARTVASATTPGPAAPEVVPSVTQRGQWLLIETPSFRVWTRLEREQAVALARRCENVRDALRAKWLSHTTSDCWTPKAEVVVHPTATDYSRALGQSSENSSGGTTVTIDGGRVVSRRVDLRADAAGWSASSLPHELTHLVLADRFAGRQLPRWVDEGMAVLSESESKLAERRQRASDTNARGKPRPLSELLFVRDYPSAEQRAAFYSQSAALVEFLVARAGHEQFLLFVERAMEVDYDRALKEVYHIEGVRALQSEWDRQGAKHQNSRM